MTKRKIFDETMEGVAADDYAAAHKKAPLFACFCIKVLSPDQRKGRTQWHY